MIDHKDIHEAIVAVMQEVGYVQKQKSPNLNYSYAGEAALIAALRPVMIENGVYCYVSKITPVRDTFTTAKGTSMNVTVSQGEVTFVHAKSGTSITVQAIGEGMDTGDKSANKSATGLLKYGLRQTFLIETGDDPDTHDSKPMERKKEEQQSLAEGKRAWTLQQKQAIVDAKFADNINEAKAMLDHSVLKDNAGVTVVTSWAKYYRASRDEGKEVIQAAQTANEAYKLAKNGGK